MLPIYTAEHQNLTDTTQKYTAQGKQSSQNLALLLPFYIQSYTAIPEEFTVII